MITRPPLIFLDEPTAGLDPRSREQVWSTVRGVVDTGTTIFLTTQYLEEADRLADRIAMLNNGRIVAEGTAAELKSSIAGEVAVFEFADDETFGRAREALRTTGTEELEESPERCVVEVSTDGSAAQISALLSHLDASGAPVHRMSLHRPSLDDVFLSLTTEPVMEVVR